MTVNMKQAVGRQTISHFLYTFMKDYDTEKAADRTMKSKYVPYNLKTQLVSAMSRCDADDRSRIERVARLGMFIDNSCNELVYYNTVMTVVTRWTLSMYVDSDEVKRVFEVIMADVGCVCDSDIQFIMEKYHYLEERDAQFGSSFSACETGLAGLLKAKKYSPDTSLIRYYGQSLWLKILKALLRNSVKAFHTDSFGSVFTGLVVGEQDGRDEGVSPHENGLDDESKALYKEFHDKRKEWFKTMAKVNSEKLEDLDSRTPCSDLRKPPEPSPDVSYTAFDVQFDDDDDDGGEEDSDVSVAETVLEAPQMSSPPPPPELDSSDSERCSSLAVARSPVKELVNVGATYVATRVIREKQMHILSDDLRDVVVREKTSRALSSHVNCVQREGRDGVFSAVERVNNDFQRLRIKNNNTHTGHKRKIFNRRRGQAALPYFKLPALPLPPPPPPTQLSNYCNNEIQINEIPDSPTASTRDGDDDRSVCTKTSWFTEEEQPPFSVFDSNAEFPL